MNLLRKLLGTPSQPTGAGPIPQGRNPSSSQPEAFVWLNKQGVRSSLGYEVQCVERFEEEYREGGRVITIPIERGFYGGSSVGIEPRAFERWNGSSVLNSTEEQARMLRNFKAAMAFQGVEVEP